MEVSLFPNTRRPGVGLAPKRESARPLLPQHARLCPVLEAGSASGHLVFPPLKPHEAFHVSYQGEGRYVFAYYLNPDGKQWQGIFQVTWSMPIGGVGTSREDVVFAVPGSHSVENASLMARMFVSTEDLGTPAGAITLRGAWNFKTPDGWDTLFTPVFNHVERPVAPMLVIRVETDWYVHDTEFRYILQPGEGISGAHHLPIGQVLFLPREAVSLRECSQEEIAALTRSRDEFADQKAASRRPSPYGLPFSPHYARCSHERQRAMASTDESHGAGRNGPPGPDIPAQGDAVHRHDMCGQ